MASKTPAKTRRKAAHSSGRQARAKSASLTPDEQDLYERFAKMTGVGFSELVRRQLTPKIRAAVGMLDQLEESGLSPIRAELATFVPGMPEDTRRVFYGDSDPHVEERE